MPKMKLFEAIETPCGCRIHITRGSREGTQYQIAYCALHSGPAIKPKPQKEAR